MSELENQGVLLNEGIRLKDLVSNGAHFQINHQSVEEDVFPELMDDISDDDEADELVASPWKHSFADLKKQMVKLPNYRIYKKVIKEGEGSPVGDMKARVECHFDAFFEKEERAFDSTHLRKSIFRFVTGRGATYVGIEQAISTMCKKEESQFIIGYEFMYGEMGCPPRILQKSDCLFVIQLVNFNETGDDDACEQIDDVDKRKFQVVKEKADEARKRGVECFKLGQYEKSCRSFHSAVTALEFCKLRNEEEQNEQRYLLIKLYTNLAVCYNKREMWSKTCSMCNELFRITNVKKDLKILFNYATAMFHLTEYGRARVYAKYAYAIDPQDVKVNRLLSDIEKFEKEFKSQEKKFCQKIFAVVDKAKENSNQSEFRS